MTIDQRPAFLFSPAPIPPDQSGVLLAVTPGDAGWESIGFSVRRLAAGDTWSGSTGDDEVALVVLGGKLSIDWGEGARSIGKRKDVFGGYPYAVYLPCRTSFEVRAETLVELAESRAASQLTLRPRVITPEEIGSEIRGGGDTTRQILRLIRPEDEADRLLINEIYTPGGNWSSYPPHKHDTNNPPHEVAKDEFYYFRTDHPDGYGLLRQYSNDGAEDDTVTIRDGDLVALREGYHLVAAPPGYRVYYMAVLAGTTRSMAASTDPRYAHLSKARPTPDPRVPVVSRDS
ncbi:MAG: 5-deoxy-glucuronate isomerase [Acidobacteria bacterium]|nr:5-deoxy-glucuronate isomerase [Acidobacteriota bacterium]